MIPPFPEPFGNVGVDAFTNPNRSVGMLWSLVVMVSACARTAERPMDAAGLRDASGGSRDVFEIVDGATSDTPEPSDAARCSGELAAPGESCSLGCGVTVTHRPRPCPSVSLSEAVWCVPRTRGKPIEFDCMVVDVDGVSYLYNGREVETVYGMVRPCEEADLIDAAGCHDSGAPDGGVPDSGVPDGG